MTVAAGRSFSIVDKLQLRPLSGTKLIGLYLATSPSEKTGEVTESQWVLMVDRAEWLIKTLRQSIRDVRKGETKHDEKRPNVIVAESEGLLV